MAFKESDKELSDSILNYLGITSEDLVESWESIKKAVKDEELSYEEHSKAASKNGKLSALHSDDMVAKTIEVTNDVLDKLLIGTIHIGNAKELSDIIQAVDLAKQLVSKYKLNA